MAVWPWYGALVKGVVYEAGEFLQVAEYKNVVRWTDQIAERPAVKRGRMVNRAQGDPASQLRERHDASDFDLRTQDKLDAALDGAEGKGQDHQRLQHDDRQRVKAHLEHVAERGLDANGGDRRHQQPAGNLAGGCRQFLGYEARGVDRHQ
eukprot:gene24299-45012_t